MAQILGRTSDQTVQVKSANSSSKKKRGTDREVQGLMGSHGISIFSIYSFFPSGMLYVSPVSWCWGFRCGMMCHLPSRATHLASNRHKWSGGFQSGKPGSHRAAEVWRFLCKVSEFIFWPNYRDLFSALYTLSLLTPSPMLNGLRTGGLVARQQVCTTRPESC